MLPATVQQAVGRLQPRLLKPVASALHKRPDLTRSLTTRPDGFYEGLPPRGWVFSVLAAAGYAGAYFGAEEGRLRPLVESVEVNTDPNATPTPKMIFHALWPLVAGMFCVAFEGIAAKLSLTSDFKWLCTEALQDDMKAPVALCLLSVPAEHPTFARAVAETPGVLERTKQIIAVYRSLPKDTHDDVLAHAAILASKVSALRPAVPNAFTVDEFAWLIPAVQSNDQNVQAGIEGFAYIWPEQRVGALVSGAPMTLHKVAQGRYSVQQELATRVLGGMQDALPVLREDVERVVKAVQRADAMAPKQKKKTLWQATGVSQRETEGEQRRQQRSKEMATMLESLTHLENMKKVTSPTLAEQYGKHANVLCAAVCGAVWGALRCRFRCWRLDITPSTARECARYVALRASMGCGLLMGAVEVGSAYKKQQQELAGPQPYTEKRVEELMMWDAANLAVLAGVNFLFPYCILVTLFCPLQFMLPPGDTTFPRVKTQPKE